MVASRAVAALAALALAAGCNAGTDGAPLTTARAVVVLPLTGEPEQRARAFSQEVADGLSRVAGVRVVPGGSAPRRAHDAAQLREVASLLNVGAVLHGTMRAERNKITVVLRLVGVERDTLLWSRELAADTSALRAVERRVVQDVSDAMLASAGIRQAGSPSDTSVTVALRAASERAAYSRQLALKGDIGEALREARRAHELDPLSADLHRNYVELLTRAKRTREASQETARLRRTTRYLGSQP